MLARYIYISFFSAFLDHSIMPIPDYQTLMLPLLKLARDKQEHRFRDAIEHLASEFKLTDDERGTMLPSGTAPVFDNRVGWARTYLKQAALLESHKRGVFCITREALNSCRRTQVGLTTRRLNDFRNTWLLGSVETKKGRQATFLKPEQCLDE
ncbi:winged helix-turn-helix domain-containing protein [Propionivibrio sp.]|uniref:winged helix-turn-helix domain-containing protein n=1 Tax=Propionivibrio sp. TaxID=2212460 RepID=UPI0025D52E7D|nr:winged helix-turn-helix domain-containing protein [Propionivibrio sp.]